MNPLFIPVIGNLLDRLFPDKAAADEAKLKVMQMAQTGELAELDADVKLATGQVEVNKVEAASSSVFVAGWRPFVGWTCGLAFFFKYVGGPGFFVLAQLFGKTIVLPTLDATELTPILLGMLGLAGMRSWDKLKGVAK